MDTKIARATLKVIRKERKRRTGRLSNDADAAYDQWLFVDGPFINELCLILLVAVRHQVERELLNLGARVAGADMTRQDFRGRLEVLRKLLKSQKGWKALEKSLQLTAFADWTSSMETLRLLANCYKHAPSLGPERGLLEHLKLDISVKYAPLPESDALREGLALSLSLPKETDYCEIAEEFVKRADLFLKAVRRQKIFAKVSRGAVLFDPKTFLN